MLSTFSPRRSVMPLLAHEVLERAGDLLIEEPEHLAAALDKRDPHAERGHDAGVLRRR